MPCNRKEPSSWESAIYYALFFCFIRTTFIRSRASDIAEKLEQNKHKTEAQIFVNSYYI